MRNTCYTWLQQNRGRAATVAFDEAIHSSADMAIRPDSALLQGEDRQLIRQALEELPLEFREVLVLRELEGLSYKAIAEIVNVPLGTVMSRLARGRERLE